MKKTSRNTHSTMNELNITPLLDLVFVLLVIFIITTPQMVNNLEMALPSGKPQEEDPNAPKPKVNRINVEENSQIVLNEEPVTAAQLKEKLQQLKTADPEMAVVVGAADQVEYQGMITVLDVLQQLEITKVGLATQ